MQGSTNGLSIFYVNFMTFKNVVQHRPASRTSSGYSLMLAVLNMATLWEHDYADAFRMTGKGHFLVLRQQGCFLETEAHLKCDPGEAVILRVLDFQRNHIIVVSLEWLTIYDSTWVDKKAHFIRAIMMSVPSWAFPSWKIR